MGLAPYGNPSSKETKHFIELIKDRLVSVFDDGSIFLNQRYFRYAYGLTMTNNKEFKELFGFRKRNANDPFTAQHVNFAWAIQNILEEIVFKLAKHARQITGSSNLCLAGGVALNCVANSRVQNEHIFSKIFVQPASGDAGGALGAALSAYHIYFEKPVERLVTGDNMKASFLGPSFSEDMILMAIEKYNLDFQRYNSRDELCLQTAQLLAEGKVIGWFQGKMEFGPRALGNRSILANAAYPGMQQILNQKIKFREGFRPFAPAVLYEDANDYFQIDFHSPYMLFVFPLKRDRLKRLPSNYLELSLDEKLYYPRSDLQAITHVDGTARVQTVSKLANPEFYQLLTAYKRLTNCSVLVNTSFNVKDEPIVCNPDDALTCFLKTKMDHLVIGQFFISKRDKPSD